MTRSPVQLRLRALDLLLFVVCLFFGTSLGSLLVLVLVLVYSVLENLVCKLASMNEYSLGATVLLVAHTGLVHLTNMLRRSEAVVLFFRILADTISGHRT